MAEPKLSRDEFEKLLDIVRADFCRAINKIAKQNKLPLSDGMAFMNAAAMHLVMFVLDTNASASDQSFIQLQENFIQYMRGQFNASQH